MNDETYLLFRCGNHLYAIRQLEVLFINTSHAVIRLPEPLRHIHGLRIYEEELLLVVDCESYFFQTPVLQPRFEIFVQMAQTRICLVAEEVLGSVQIDENAWKKQEMEPFIYCEFPEERCYFIPLETERRELHDQNQ